MKRLSDRGISLLNVLVVVAIGASLIQLMLTSQDRALAKAQEANDRAQAESLARAGVTSVAIALRRDFSSAPDADHMQEPWAKAAQEAVALDFGQFEVLIEDARGRFDMNSLGPRALSETRVFLGLLAALDLPEALVQQVSQAAPYQQVSDLKSILSAGDYEALEPHIVALPERSPMNLNTATEALLSALFQSSAAARNLVARRAARGHLEPSDLSALGLIQPPLAGFTSQVFDVYASATVGVAHQASARRLVRDAKTGTIHSVPLK